MTYKDHGYYGYAYIGARLAKVVTLVPIIGLVGNFLSLIAKSKHSPPSELVATIAVTCAALLWTIISMTAYDDTHIPYLATFAVDMLFLVPFLVVAILLGQPLSVTTCSDLPNEQGSVVLPLAASAGQPVSYVVFSGAGRTVCYELMAVWGLVLALCVLFATSSIAAGFLYLGKRRAAGPRMGIGNGGRGFMVGGAAPGGYQMNESQIEMAPPKPFSRSPSLGPQNSAPGSPTGGFGGESFDGPPHQRSVGGYDSPGAPGSPTGSFGGPLSPPPAHHRNLH